MFSIISITNNAATSILPRWLNVSLPPANGGDTEDASLIPASGRCPGGGNGNTL